MKRLMLGTTAVLALLLLLSLGAPLASADTISYALTVPNTAVSPYPSPYGNVTINLTSSTTATITFDALTSGGFTYMFIDGGSADVNVNATSFSAAFGSATGPSIGGFSSPSFVSFTSNGSVDGFGSFNNQTKMFNGTDHPATQIVFTLTDLSGTWASASNVLTANNRGFLAAAHIVVFNSNNVVNGQQLATGFVANGTPSVPDGGMTLMLLGGALVGIETLRRKFHV